VREVLLGRKDLKELRDQWPKVSYLDRWGTKRTHVFDYCARYASGLVEALAVRPGDRVDYVPRTGAPSLREALRLIEDQGSAWKYVHRIRIVTEEEVSDDDAYNAGWLRRARRYRVDEDVAEAKQALRSLGPRFRFYDLVRGAAVEWRRTHAVWTLIDEGILVAESPEAILDRTWLLVTQSMKEAA